MPALATPPALEPVAPERFATTGRDLEVIVRWRGQDPAALRRALRHVAGDGYRPIATQRLLEGRWLCRFAAEPHAGAAEADGLVLRLRVAGVHVVRHHRCVGRPTA
jgi:hypothetical protein